MSKQTKFFQVTNQVLLSYTSDQYNVTTKHAYQGEDRVSYYMYQTDDAQQHFVEVKDIHQTKYPLDDMATTYYYGGKSIEDFDLSEQQYYGIVGSDIYINDRNVGVVILDKDGESLRYDDINHDTIRLYLLTGYVMNSIGGYAINVKCRVSEVTMEDENGNTSYRRIDDYINLLDYYLPKEELKDNIHWLPQPLYMNSKFYDRYVEISVPSAFDIA